MRKNVRNDEDELDLEVDRLSFQQVQDFKYFEFNINIRDCMHSETNFRLKVRNGCYFAMSYLLSYLKLLSNKIIEKCNISQTSVDIYV